MSRLNLLTYNAFGLMKISRGTIVTTITAVQLNGKPLNRTLTEEMTPEIEQIGPGENASLVFAALIEPGKKSRIIIREFGALASNVDAGDIPQVEKSLTKALELIRKSVQI